MTVYKAIVFSAIFHFMAEGNYEAAKKLRHFIRDKRMILGISDTDTEIEIALTNYNITPYRHIPSKYSGYNLEFRLPKER